MRKDSLYCSTPRKSLVKGERFIRSEVEPEYTELLNLNHNYL